MGDRREHGGQGTHKEFCLQQEGVQGLLVKLLGLEDAGGAEQVLAGRLLVWRHEVAEALLVAARRAHVQGQGDVGAPPGKSGKEGVSVRGRAGHPLGALEQENE